jgi:flagellar hook-basal body complex protein FliE
MRIDNVQQLSLEALTQTKQQEKSDSEDFKKVLKGYLNEVNELQLNAEEMDRQLAAGTLENVHEATIAAEKAALTLELTIQIRNKVVEAYQEIMRMSI